ncbi:MAG: hypothetical protein M0Z65_05905 [Firmicutes bacterium]|uniref:Uncharacterized protein n=1 Tax=Melghirimyces thermohalophilus TaxID=1236220 RepID=A0A1G6NT72_9BACL|nr:hypothetical protein [Melghirimyces thermohalophilus]MDA8352717.1 hypothetical protein [Bacillota bacterium]SDC70948.1 hypothetical protein SAMN04488112_11423 [Melghirimyces thermohalophilus]
MQENRQEFQLTSVDQALMDELAGRVRECYREMTEIAMRAMNEESIGDESGADGKNPFHDEEIRWWMGPGRELCYRKDGGKVEVRPAR